MTQVYFVWSNDDLEDRSIVAVMADPDRAEVFAEQFHGVVEARTLMTEMPEMRVYWNGRASRQLNGVYDVRVWSYERWSSEDEPPEPSTSPSGKHAFVARDYRTSEGARSVLSDWATQQTLKYLEAKR